MAMLQVEVDDIGMKLAGIEIALERCAVSAGPARAPEAAAAGCRRGPPCSSSLAGRRCPLRRSRRLPLAVRRRGAVRGRHRDARRGGAAHPGEPQAARSPRAAPGAGEMVLVTRRRSWSTRRPLIGCWRPPSATWRGTGALSARCGRTAATTAPQSGRRCGGRPGDLGIEADGRGLPGGRWAGGGGCGGEVRSGG